MVGVDRVAQSECIGEEGRPKQDRVIVQGDEGPKPDQHIGANQQSVNADQALTKTGVALIPNT